MADNKTKEHDRWRQSRIHKTPEPYRTEFQRDRDRIMYSLAFRRLAGITQVTAAGEAHLLHNRMSHSLKVSQIGRRLAEKLKADEKSKDLYRKAFINEDVVEAAGLAHDLGHPPFGHIGEDALNRMLGGGGSGFEGNAQSFRIVTKLAHHRTPAEKGPLGLDLTNATLNAILKYPRQLGPKHSDGDRTDIHWGGYKDKGFYASEQSVFKRVHSDGDFDEAWRSPEAVLMDLADDLAYVLHDVEDFYRAGLIPLHELYNHPVTDESFKFYAKNKVLPKFGYDRKDERYDERKSKQFERDFFNPAYELFEKSLSLFKQPYLGRRIDDDHLQQFYTAILSQATDAIQLKEFDTGPLRIVTVNPITQRLDPTVRLMIAIIRELTWFYVIDRPSLAVLQRGQDKIICTVFERLVDLLFDEKKNPVSPRGIPTQLQVILNLQKEDRGANEEMERKRAVSDFICILTEDQVMDLFQRFTGQTQQSVFGAWFQ